MIWGLGFVGEKHLPKKITPKPGKLMQMLRPNSRKLPAIRLLSQIPANLHDYSNCHLDEAIG